jgi:hypothetical protein
LDGQAHVQRAPLPPLPTTTSAPLTAISRTQWAKEGRRQAKEESVKEKKRVNCGNHANKSGFKKKSPMTL